MVARILLNPSLLGGMCVPTLFLMNFRACLFLELERHHGPPLIVGQNCTPLGSCLAWTWCAWWGTRGGSYALACSLSRSLCGPCWGPLPWGNTEPWLLLFNGCHRGKIHLFSSPANCPTPTAACSTQQVFYKKSLTEWMNYEWMNEWSTLWNRFYYFPHFVNKESFQTRAVTYRINSPFVCQESC